MTKLAIKSHPTRGHEVIEILEMLGGENNIKEPYDGSVYKSRDDTYYSIDDNNRITMLLSKYIPTSQMPSYIFFTLEELLEKFPYKVGDKVIIDTDGKVMTVERMHWTGISIEYYCTNDTMGYHTFAGLLRPYVEQQGEITADIIAKAADECLFGEQSKGKDMEATKLATEWTLPDGYEFQDEQGNVIHATKIVLKKKPPQYPKTYAECCEILGLEAASTGYTRNSYKPNLIYSLQALLICRDAYWKQAGDWKPLEQELTKRVGYSNCESVYAISDLNGCILQFPTEEMRDTFFENFKELIEAVKELL